MKLKIKNYSSGFTLLELLIVIGILAIISVTMIIVINPTDLLARARDSNRISNLSAINSAINVLMSFYSDASLGSANTVYTSLPSDQSDCSDLGLPTLPGTWVYHCVTEANLRKIDANGWVPIDFTQMDTGSPLSHLPVDPINTVASGYYYTYTTGGSWELNGILESEKYQQDTTVSKGNLPGVLSFGSDSSLSPIFNNSGLVGYWKFDEGLGTTAYDSSGNGNTGTLYGSTWTTGKVGNALSFDGVDDYVDCGDPANGRLDFGVNTDFSVEMWVNPTFPISASGVPVLLNKGGAGTSKGFFIRITNPTYTAVINDGTNKKNISFNLNIQSGWQQYVVTFDRDGYMRGYLNGVAADNPLNISIVGDISTSIHLIIGKDQDSAWMFDGFIDEIRMYNRALSPAEIKARYNATK